MLLKINYFTWVGYPVHFYNYEETCCNFVVNMHD